MVEQYYIYVRELFNLFIKELSIVSQLKREDKDIIIEKIKEKLMIFINQNSGYLNELVEMLKEIKKNYFYEIVVFVIEKLNEYGKKCLEKKQKFCRYHSLTYFEKAYSYFKIYIVNLKNLAICGKLLNKFKKDIDINISFINDIKSNAILLNKKYFELDKYKNDDMSGFYNYIIGLKINLEDKKEKLEIVLNNYEKMLAEFSNKITEEKAICIINILKISIFLGYSNYKNYIRLAEYCEVIVKYLDIDINEDWVKEFQNIYQKIKELYKKMQIPRKDIKNKYKNQFDEIDNKFLNRKNNNEFIDYILKLYPYEGYENDKNIKDFKNNSLDLIKYLMIRYNPDNYYTNSFEEDEKSLLFYSLMESIYSYLSTMLNKYNDYIII